MACALAAQTTLNAFLGLGPKPRQRATRRAQRSAEGSAQPRHGLLHAAKDCRLHLPAKIGDYTDFYAGINHAEAVGKLFRPDAPLMPNYKHVPIAYHGRASSICLSGAQVRRPNGQRLPPGASEPVFGPCQRLDYELEMGIWIGDGNELGAPVPIAKAGDAIAGFCLLNDWSARDIQAWGIPAARAVPRQEFPDEHFHMDRHAGGAGMFRCAVMERGSAIPSRCPI